MAKKNILVFPCGSEVALEIHRSIRYSRHFHLVGASSVADHGRFVFDDYVGGIPYHTAENFIESIREVVADKQIDAIYPAMDGVARTLKRYEDALPCRVIGSSAETTAACASKLAIYAAVSGIVPCPEWSRKLDDMVNYPIFIKPDEGYGSRGICQAGSVEQARAFAEANNDKQFVFSECLPGQEYTIDCLSDRNGQLLFSGARVRQRVMNGISVGTTEADEQQQAEFQIAAEIINQKLQPRGAWFFR